MKTLVFKILSIVAVVISVSSCTNNLYQSRYQDDIYYSSKDKISNQTSVPQHDNQQINNQTVINDQNSIADQNSSNYNVNNSDIIGSNYQSGNDSLNYSASNTEYYSNNNLSDQWSYRDTTKGNTYITNNYYDDYYDYAYTARLKRFYHPSYFGYYDSYYTDLYWYTYDPFFWGTSIYLGYNWWLPSFYFGISPFWHWGFYSSFYVPYYYSPAYGHYPGHYGYNHNRYYYGSRNNTYYYNSYDKTSHYNGARGTNAGARSYISSTMPFNQKYEMSTVNAMRSSGSTQSGARISNPNNSNLRYQTSTPNRTNSINNSKNTVNSQIKAPGNNQQRSVYKSYNTPNNINNNNRGNYSNRRQYIENAPKTAPRPRSYQYSPQNAPQRQEMQMRSAPNNGSLFKSLERGFSGGSGRSSGGNTSGGGHSSGSGSHGGRR
ncbi:MAG: hypothetical protein Q8880_05725 [Bacteroidota bacterium]|nr:hypothetical protein [Bacteroidota bacterium]